MPGKDPIDAVNAIHNALKGLDEEGQVKALQAAVVLLGITPASLGLSKSMNNAGGWAQTPSDSTQHGSGTNGASQVGSAAEYFKAKNPQGLMEVLAVAARYRELTAQADSHA